MITYLLYLENPCPVANYLSLLYTVQRKESLSSLMILASEKDLMYGLSADDIISGVAQSTPSLKSHLLS